jgi:hypothetical protein
MTLRQQARAATWCEQLARTTLANGDTDGAMTLYEAAARIHEAAGAMSLGRTVRNEGQLMCSIGPA